MHRVSLLKQAEKFLDKQNQLVRKRVKNSLLRLAENPYDASNNDIKKLKSYGDRYRLRIGDIRLIYKVIDDELIISVIKIGYRGDIY